MRTVVIGALALTSGCNWVFGLDPVTLTDARVDDAPPDARLPTVKLSAITPMLSGAGAPTEQATFVPITPAPTVAYGRIGEALTPTTYTSEDVPVGYDFAESAEPWRLVYTLSGGVPHEVHWKPSETAHPGHAVAFQLTPNDRDSVPSGAVFTLAPTSAPVWNVPRVYTTNAWTLTRLPDKDVGTVTVNYDTVGTVAMAGPKRTPDSQKDYAIVIDYRKAPGVPECDVSTGTAAFHILDLVAGTNDGPQMFKAESRVGDYTIATMNEVSPKLNLALANGFAAAADMSTFKFITSAPAGRIPLYTHTENASFSDDPVRVPPGILLAKCEDGPTVVPGFSFPSRVSMSTVGTMMFSTPQLSLANGGPAARNTFSVSTLANAGPYNVTFVNAGFAVEPTIDATSVNITNANTIAIAPAGVTASLDFMLAGEDVLVDLYEATLYRVDGSALVPIREFTFTEKPLRFDRAQGQPAGTRYVFQIRVIRGASANTVNADFSVWGNTQSLGVTHTKAFTLD